MYCPDHKEIVRERKLMENLRIALTYADWSEFLEGNPLAKMAYDEAQELVGTPTKPIRTPRPRKKKKK